MLIYDYIIKDFMLFNKKKEEKVVASAPTPSKEPKVEKKEVKKCKFHKSHDRHCITCNQ